MKTLCFATNNLNKLSEIKGLLLGKYNIQSLEDVGCSEELPEDQDTLEGNSLQKAQYLFDHYQVNCFADDTGLEIAVLNGEPGVYSARYAGPQRSNADNMRLVMDRLEGKTNRSAQFRTVITLIENGETHQFEGIVKGEIIEEQRGSEGFGYDPIFIPEGYNTTFAEMTQQQKSSISHRGKAIEKLIAYLRANSTK